MARPKGKTIYNVSEFDLRDNQRMALDSYVNNFGNISQACRDAGVERQSWYNWSAEDKFKIAREGAKAEVVRRKVIQDEDRVTQLEDQLMKNALDGKENSLIFGLKNLAPERWRNDYIQGQVYIQNNKNTLNFVHTEVSDMTNKELLDAASKLVERVKAEDAGTKSEDAEVKKKDQGVTNEKTKTIEVAARVPGHEHDDG